MIYEIMLFLPCWKFYRVRTLKFWEWYISLLLISYLLTVMLSGFAVMQNEFTVMLNEVKHLYKDSSLTLRMTGSVNMYIIT